MSPLTSEATAVLGGPEWLASRRHAASTRFAELGLPDATDEVWRYSPIGDLDLNRFSEVAATEEPRDGVDLDGFVVTVSGGIPTLIGSGPAGIDIALLSEHPEGESLLGKAAHDDEAIAALNTSHLGDGLVIDVARAQLVATPIVVVHEVGAGATFSRVIVRVADGAAATVVEIFRGGSDDTLNVPVTELLVGDGAHLRYGSIQTVDRGAWHLGTIKAVVERAGTIVEFTAGLGGAYDRCRTDTVLAGVGAASILRSTYLGEADQIHDLRTKQDHAAPKTTSDLLCKGAVTGTARSIYSGLIKVRNGAVRADAMQTNHNLVLSETAHADTVPNLDISENDVRCSHASTVGPIDEEQRYYLESRGITPEVADRLLIRGFFRDLLERTDVPGALDLVADEIERRLEEVVLS